MFFWYIECDVCHQGRLTVVIDRDADKLFLLCEECSATYLSLDTANQDGQGFVGLETVTGLPYATAGDLDRHGWPRARLQEDVP